MFCETIAMCFTHIIVAFSGSAAPNRDGTCRRNLAFSRQLPLNNNSSFICTYSSSLICSVARCCGMKCVVLCASLVHPSLLVSGLWTRHRLHHSLCCCSRCCEKYGAKGLNILIAVSCQTYQKNIIVRRTFADLYGS